MFATVGLHPHEAWVGVQTIADLLDTPGVVAVGEAGLDYFYDHSSRQEQRAAFAEQVQLADGHEFPLVIHSRDAWDDTFDVLGAEGVPDRTVFHCFTGGPDEARRCLDLGAFVSFWASSRSERYRRPGRAAVPRRPAARRDRQPVPRADPPPRRNQPAGVGYPRRAVLAELRGVTTESVEAASPENVRLAFPALFVSVASFSCNADRG